MFLLMARPNPSLLAMFLNKTRQPDHRFSTTTLHWCCKNPGTWSWCRRGNGRHSGAQGWLHCFSRKEAKYPSRPSHAKNTPSIFCSWACGNSDNTNPKEEFQTLLTEITKSHTLLEGGSLSTCSHPFRHFPRSPERRRCYLLALQTGSASTKPPK